MAASGWCHVACWASTAGGMQAGRQTIDPDAAPFRTPHVSPAPRTLLSCAADPTLVDSTAAACPRRVSLPQRQPARLRNLCPSLAPAKMLAASQRDATWGRDRAVQSTLSILEVKLCSVTGGAI